MSILTRVPREVYDRNRSVFGAFDAGTEFQLGTARGMAWLSQLAYETETDGKIAGVLAAWGLQQVGDAIACRGGGGLPTAMTHGFVAAGRGATIIAFAGTDPLLLANWATNFHIALADNGAARGFHSAAAIALDPVLDRL